MAPAAHGCSPRAPPGSRPIPPHAGGAWPEGECRLIGKTEVGELCRTASRLLSVAAGRPAARAWSRDGGDQGGGMRALTVQPGKAGSTQLEHVPEPDPA